MTIKPETTEMLDSMQRKGWAKLSTEQKRVVVNHARQTINEMDCFLDNLANDAVITLDLAGELFRHASKANAGLRVLVALLKSEVE